MTPSLTRDLRRLAAGPFDLLVIGGGIYGLTTACDAAQRGLSVAVVERLDFGGATSFNHLRTIHGGLRYLQTLDFARARESVRERRALARVAPWAVAPLPFVLPLQRSVTRGAAAMRAGFALDRVIGSDRNDGIPTSLRLPAGRVLAGADVRQRYPELNGTAMTAAARWYDYVTTEPERLTFGWALGAAACGAVLANYAEARALTAASGQITGATVVDQLTGGSIAVRARTVVNATGAQINALLATAGAQVTLPLLKAVNLVTRRPAPEAALGGRSRSGRNVFLVPWRGRALFGTWESAYFASPGDLAVTDADLDAFIDELHDAFPAYGLTRDDVTLVHRGIVPARPRHGAPPTLDGHELVFEHRADGLDGLISVAGTKYTTARAVAERIVDRVAGFVGRPVNACRSAETRLPSTALRGDALLQHAASHEMVVTLADAVLRRTSLGSLGCPDDATLARAAQVVGGVLAWSETRQRDEIAAVRRLY